jgi:hypothetical protein
MPASGALAVIASFLGFLRDEHFYALLYTGTPSTEPASFVYEESKSNMEFASISLAMTAVAEPCGLVAGRVRNTSTFR